MTIEALAISFLAGLATGGLYFAGLWKTVETGLKSDWAVAWFAGSLFVRIGLMLGVFWIASQYRADRLLACLAGFVLARFIAIRMISPHQPRVVHHGGSNETCA